MTVTLDNTNAITFFFSLLKMIRVDILDKFEIPGIGVTYWDFTIGLAITAVVLTVLVNTVRIGTVNYSFNRGSAEVEHNESGKVSKNRALYQRGSSGSVTNSNLSGGYRSKPQPIKQPIFDRQGRRVN